MKCFADICKLSEEKRIDSQCLADAGRYDAAYYFAGYVVELLIKARVCKTLGIDDFFDFGNPAKTKIPMPVEAYKPYKVHDLKQLMVFSGLYTVFNADLTTDIKLKGYWSIICDWNENSRYLTSKTTKDVTDLLTSIDYFKQWIQKHL